MSRGRRKVNSMLCSLEYIMTLATGAVNGRKKRLPAVVPDTRAHGVIFQQAEQRRAARLAKKRAAASETPERAADRILKPITHRQGSPTLAPALEVRPDHTAVWILTTAEGQHHRGHGRHTVLRAQRVCKPSTTALHRWACPHHLVDSAASA